MTTPPGKTKLVLIHGYGGSSVMFWKIIKPLSEAYHLILLDILGMGASSRPEFTCETEHEANEFFISWVEKWRVGMGNLEQPFILAGHSFGGFVAGHYACRYPERVKKLLMLSPFGVPKRDFTDEEFAERYDAIPAVEGKRKPPKFAFKLSKKMWEKKWSPFGGLRKGGNCFVKMMLGRWAKNRIGGSLPENELLDYKDYMLMTLTRPGSSEYALFVCFDHYCFAKLPLDHDDYLKSLKIPISFFYGDRDWMTNVGTHNALAGNPYLGTHSKRYTLPNSDHHLYFDNPEGLVELILQDLSNLHELDIIQPPGVRVEEVHIETPLIVEEQIIS